MAHEVGLDPVAETPSFHPGRPLTGGADVESSVAAGDDEARRPADIWCLALSVNNASTPQGSKSAALRRDNQVKRNSTPQDCREGGGRQEALGCAVTSALRSNCFALLASDLGVVWTSEIFTQMRT